MRYHRLSNQYLSLLITDFDSTTKEKTYPYYLAATLWYELTFVTIPLSKSEQQLSKISPVLAWLHQAITWTNVNLLSMMPGGIHLMTFSLTRQSRLICKSPNTKYLFLVFRYLRSIFLLIKMEIYTTPVEAVLWKCGMFQSNDQFNTANFQEIMRYDITDSQINTPRPWYRVFDSTTKGKHIHTIQQKHCCGMS